MSSEQSPVAVVLAAGKSTRMKSDLPKVLHELCGQPILGYVLDALKEAGIHRVVVVVGFAADQVMARFADRPGIEFVTQTEQRGTGHAVAVCADALKDHRGPVYVLAGDAPMIRPELLATMRTRFDADKPKALLATAIVADPFGLGRILRDEKGAFQRIVEQKDATPAEAAVCEINPSFYLFDGPALFDSLAKVTPNNAQGEFYLTDVPGILCAAGEKVVAEPLADEIDMYGVNHRRHLADAHAMMQDRIQQRHLDAGVTIVDPRSTFISPGVTIGRDTIVLPFSVIMGPTTIGSRCRLGPFAHVREGSTIADDCVIGAFVEVVRTNIGPATMCRHLAYLGDATLGSGVNVGAGAITANYSGGVKSTTVVGDGAFLGSGSILVAPVSVGAEAVVGAGAVVPSKSPVAAGTTVVGVPARPMAK